MSLVNNTSFVPTTNLFLAHWAAVDLALVPGAFILPNEPGGIPPGFNRAGLEALRTSLLDDLQLVQDALSGVQIAAGGIKLCKEKVYARMTRFLEVMDGYYESTEFYTARPDAPGFTAGPERFLAPMHDVQSLWARLDAAAAPSGLALPLVVEAGTSDFPQPCTAAEFGSLIAELAARYHAHRDALQVLKLARARRTQTMRFIRAVLVKYRAAVVFHIAGNQPLLDTIPKVTPEPGHTPKRVELSMQFTPPNRATGAHTESADATFKKYVLVGASGANSKLKDAVAVKSWSQRTPQPIDVTFGLAEPGNEASFWLIVRTSDGNERASAKVVVSRPIGADVS